MNELQRRVDRNSRYSIRAFARDLGLSPSSVSEYLNGRHQVSAVNAGKIAKSLGLTSKESENLFGKGRHPRESGTKQMMIEEEVFTAISDWRHLAFLEYLKLTESFDWKKLAQQLATTLQGAKIIATRMVELGFCEKTSKGFALIRPDNQIFSTAPSVAIRRFHSTVLERALAKINVHEVDRRDLRSSIVAIDKHQLQAAKKLIAKFHKDLLKVLEKPGKKDAVYCFSSQFFQITEDL